MKFLKVLPEENKNIKCVCKGKSCNSPDVLQLH